MAIGSMAAIDSHACPCLCVDALYLNVPSFRSRYDLKQSRWSGSVEFGTSWVGKWRGWRVSGNARKLQRRRRDGLVVVDELGGQYEEGFEDVHKHLIGNFTQKAVRTVLHQLYEMNPPKYMWFYNFSAANNAGDSKVFLRTLAKESQELAERVMVTRLHLYGKWVKKCDHAKMYQRISDENLELMRERLRETIIWPSDDTNSLTDFK